MESGKTSSTFTGRFQSENGDVGDKELVGIQAPERAVTSGLLKGQSSLFSSDAIAPAIAAQARANGNPQADWNKLQLGLDNLYAEAQSALSGLSGAARTSAMADYSSQFDLAPVKNGYVTIDAFAKDGDGAALLELLQSLGLEKGVAFGSAVSGRLPIDAIDDLAAVNSLSHARPVLAMTRAGSVTSRDGAALQADVVTSESGFDGTGVTIGILSDSFNTSGNAIDYAADIASGDLPGDVLLLDDSVTDGTIDEGRAMAQLIHDIAPGASLAFHTAFGGIADFAQGIIDLANAGADIIVDDVIYFAEPMFQDGIIAQAVDTVHAQGVTFFSSAGNNGDNSFEDSFRMSGVFNPTFGQLHDWDPSADVDTTLSITIGAGQNILFVLQWDQPFGASTSDVDIILTSGGGLASTLDAGGTIVAGSAAGNIGGDPVEIFSFTNTSGTAQTFDLNITLFEGPAPSLFKIVDFGNGLTINEYLTLDKSTSYGHANAEGALAVGAAFNVDTPEFGQDPPLLESFSSEGGVPILFDVNGNRLDTPIIRDTVDFTATDGGNTTFFGQQIGDGDDFPNFFGTSAAAPNAAAVAALLLQAFPDATPDQIEFALESTAIDIVSDFNGAPLGVGYDLTSGAGLIQADAALAALEALLSPTTTVTVLSEGFETNGNPARYTTSVAEFTDNAGDFFIRTDGTNLGTGYSVTGFDGSFFFAAQDTNGDGQPSVVTLNFTGLDISGLTALQFAIDVGEDDASDGNEDWDANSALIIEYQIDGGGFQNLLAFQSSSATAFNTAARQDTDFDGLGDGTELTAALATFSAGIAGTGSLLDIRITFSNLDDGDEDVAIDNIVITGESEGGGEPQPGTLSINDPSVIEGDSGTTDLVFTVTRSGGTDGAVSAAWNVITSTLNSNDLVNFSSLGGTVTFADGQDTATITFSVVGDINIENNETHTIRLSNPTGGATITDSDGIGTVINDDVSPPKPAEVFINEFHYDNIGTDVGEFLEVAGTAGLDLTGYAIALYDGGTGGVYDTINLAGTIDDEGNGFGALSFARSGIQNGSPDGFALVDADGNVVQFLSYEGTFTATSGPAAGMTSVDVGRSQNAGTPAGSSIQLTGNGDTAADFTWVSVVDDSPGSLNAGQSFGPTPVPGQIFISNASVLEGDAGTSDLVFTLVREGGSDGVVSVEYSATLLAGAPPFDENDFVDFVPSGIITFADGQTVASLTFKVRGDTEFEENEVVSVVITGPTGGATIGNPFVRGTIVNDDVASSPGTLSIDDPSVIEGDSGTTDLVFTVTRSGGSAGAVSVEYSLTNGQTSNNDFTGPTSGTVTFADGETTATITIGVVGDTEIEGDETFDITLFNPTGGATITDNSGTGTILNDDLAPQGPADVFINEIHYDTAGADVGEFIEIAGPAGTDVSGWSLVLYNGSNNSVYDTEALTGIIPDQDDGFGTLAFLIPGIQNGAPDAVALVNAAGEVVQFISYEGTLTAANGPAAGLTSVDIGVSETSVPEGTSLQAGGTGFVANDFAFQPSQVATFGQVNTGQDFVAANPAGTLFINDASVVEGDAGTTAITFNVFRVGGSTGAVSADFAVAFGDAFSDADAADLSGVTSGTVSFADGETFTTITLQINGDTDGEPTEFFNVVLSNATGGVSIGDGTARGTITNDDPLVLQIGEIQGAGHTSLFVGNEVTTSGIVTAVAANGFYLQDPDGDGNSATSDALFVFTGSAPTVAVGNGITVLGTVNEFRAAGDPANLTITQLVSPTITVDSVDNPLPTAVLIGPDGISPPTETIDDDNFTVFDPENDGIDFWESLEGMLVTVQNPVAVDSTNSFGELWTVASDGAGNLLASNASEDGLVVVSGGEDALGAFNSGAGSDFNPERIQIDEAGTINGEIFAVPTVTPGTVLNDVTGVVDYAFGNFQLRPTEAVTVAQASTNVAETTSLVSGATNQLSLATYNVLNLDIRADDGDDDVGNGRFAGVAFDIGINLGAPDIVVLQEVQDDSGAINDGTVSAQLTLEALAQSIFDQTGIQYSVFDNPFVVDGQTGGQPGGNIRVAFLYREDRVDLDESSAFTITDPDDGELVAAFQGSRAPLGANFTFNGQTVTVIGNHFSSKIGSNTTFSAVQPPLNAAELSRAAQAAAVNNFVDGLLAANPDALVAVAGDFNEFQFEEPLRVLTGELDFDGARVTGGGEEVLQNLSFLLPENERYSALFEGNAQMLDHIFASHALARGAQIDAVRTNTILGNFNADHDPILALLNVGTRTITGTGVADVINGNAGNDVIDGRNGNDTIDGGGGDDSINGGAGSDTIFGGDGDDTIDGGSGRDTIDGGAGNDFIQGGFSDDILFGGAGDDILIGDNGNDTLDGGTGADLLVGGANNDLFILHADQTEADADIIFDMGFGADRIRIEGATGKTITFTQDGDNTLIAADGVLVAVVLNAEAGFVQARTTSDGIAPSVPIIGTEGTDMIEGTDGDDVIDGRGGNDTIDGGDGDDIINGGAGSDTIFGGDGQDTIDGGSGIDTIDGGAGNDIIRGGFSNDVLVGGAGDDMLMGDNGNDTLNGGTGADMLTGGANNDLFILHANHTAADADIITDLGIGADRIRIDGGSGKAITFTQVGADTVIAADGVLVATILNAEAEAVEARTTVSPPDGIAFRLMQDEPFVFAQTAPAVGAVPLAGGGAIPNLFGSNDNGSDSSGLPDIMPFGSAANMIDDPWMQHGHFGIDQLA